MLPIRSDPLKFQKIYHPYVHLRVAAFGALRGARGGTCQRKKSQQAAPVSRPTPRYKSDADLTSTRCPNQGARGAERGGGPRVARRGRGPPRRPRQPRSPGTRRLLSMPPSAPSCRRRRGSSHSCSRFNSAAMLPPPPLAVVRALTLWNRMPMPADVAPGSEGGTLRLSGTCRPSVFVYTVVDA